jgi:hypothetical protein
MKLPTNMVLGFAVALGLSNPVWAQGMTPGDQTTQSSSPSQPAAPSSANAGLTGQAIYSAAGREIGTVASMTVDANSQPAAVVTVEKFLGMGGKQVVFPVRSLQSKEGGGYTTSLSSAQIKKLPVYSPGKPQ